VNRLRPHGLSDSRRGHETHEPLQRRRAALELAVLAVAAPLFLVLVLVPSRPVLVDAGLAMLALVFIALGRHETRRCVWSDHPPESVRLRADRVLVAATLAALVLAGAAGLDAGREVDGMVAAAFLATVALFVPWAWLQHAMFQFYLLGRLRLLLHGADDLLVAGIKRCALRGPPRAPVGSRARHGAGRVALELLLPAGNLLRRWLAPP
jgi:hypothetical protein